MEVALLFRVAIKTLPQIISATTKKGVLRATKLFKVITPNIIIAKPIEAEYAKLFSNAWQYIKFSVANQFFMLANDANIDFYKVYETMTYKYKRALDLPTPGFASGPCLFKDTVQLSSTANNDFQVGTAAIQINEGLPLYLIRRLEENYNLKKKTVGILGVAFKSDIDDPRDSLSYKLRDILNFEESRESSWLMVA